MTEDLIDELIPFTPHARGSTFMHSRTHAYFAVYPACAGIDPLIHGACGAYIRLPRMRGDRPMTM